MAGNDLEYPIGRFVGPGADLSAAEREAMITELELVPSRLRAAVDGLDPRQLETPYRAGGWTVRQVVHHVPDSHLNGYVRFKLALTEDEPAFKTYRQEQWAELADTAATPVEVSVTLLGALHERWLHLLRSLRARDFE